MVRQASQRTVRGIYRTKYIYMNDLNDRDTSFYMAFHIRAITVPRSCGPDLSIENAKHKKSAQRISDTHTYTPNEVESFQ